MKNDINTVEVLLEYEDTQLRKVKSAVNQPFTNGHSPELEQSNELIPELESRYLQLIGILICAVDLMSIYIFLEVVVM